MYSPAQSVQQRPMTGRRGFHPRQGQEISIPQRRGRLWGPAGLLSNVDRAMKLTTHLKSSAEVRDGVKPPSPPYVFMTVPN
jgi:hypothetical protein